MRKKEHDRIAREVARMFHLDERLVVLGSRLPDLDLFLGKHKKSLHNPYALALSTYNPAVFIGFASHLISDALAKPLRIVTGIRKAIKDVLSD